MIRYYPLADPVPDAIKGVSYMARATGEYRPPRAGEWYLSGSIPVAYRSPVDLSNAQSFQIMRVVQVEERIIEIGGKR